MTPFGLLGLCLVACLAVGCAGARGLGALRGAPVLVVAEERPPEEAAAWESELQRSLALVPLRVWPGASDQELMTELQGEEGRLEKAREAAEARRLPWLVVLEVGGVRVETSRGGRVVWRRPLKLRSGVSPRVARVLQRALGRSGPLLRVGEPRLMPTGSLKELRSLAMEGRWQEYSAAIDLSLASTPADPAVRTHEGLRAYLMDANRPIVLLERAASMAPDGESELLAVALEAADHGNHGLELTVRQGLTRVEPDRVDYVPALADAYSAIGDNGAAMAACRAALTRVDRDQLKAISPGTRPDQAVDALPAADLAFCLGWYLAQEERWELAAFNYEEAASLYERLGRWVELGEALNNAGAAMVRGERPLTAAGVLRRAIVVREEFAPGQPLANSNYNLARALSDADRLLDAREAYDAASVAYTDAGRLEEALDARVEGLDLWVRAGDRQAFESTFEVLKEAIDALEGPIARQMLLGNLWFELGQGRMSFGDLEGSLAAYLRSLRFWEALDRPLERGQTHYAMALPHLAQRGFTDAYQTLLDALALAVELSDSSSIVAIRSQLDEVTRLIEESGQSVPVIPEELKTWLVPEGAGFRGALPAPSGTDGGAEPTSE